MTEAKNGSSAMEEIVQETIVDGQINLNNFYCKLANPRYKEGSAEAVLVTRIGWMDRPCSEIPQTGWSERMRSKTPREFLQEVDDVARHTPGVDYKKMLDMQAKLSNNQINRGSWWRGMPKDQEKIYNRDLKKAIKMLDKLQWYVLPVYIELRMRGYNRFDLIG